SASTHTGGITVSNGVLLVNNINGSGTGLGSVLVQNGATLGGNGSIGSAASAAGITIASGGKLQVGNSHGGTSGSASDLALSTSGLGTINLTGTLQFDLFTRQPGSNSTANNDVIRVTSSTAVVLGGVLEVLNSTGASTASWGYGDSWQLFDWSGVSLGTPTSGSFASMNLPALNPGLSWDTSALFTTGFITVTPEPGRVLLVLAGLFSLAWGRRRRVG
ncbi:MAG TPA: PEP-CTERM sorting domain-containing protein, partial [Prosthecobacter sp.]